MKLKPPLITLIFALCTFSHQLCFAETNFEYFFKKSSQYNDVLVKKVLSADTIQLETGEKIKLIGLIAPTPPRFKRERDREEIETPPTHALNYEFDKKEVDPTTTIDVESFTFAKELLEGQHVRLEFDVNKKSFNTTVAYIFVLPQNTFANAEILRQGFARLRIEPPNTKYEAQLREAYREARKEQRGLQAE